MESNTLLLWKDTVIIRDGHVLVCNDGDLDVGTKTTLLLRLVSPGKVRKLGASRDVGVM